ncbi:unnamed protein product [Moneuplotes crassus]|uniref:Uncharacterized protein n=1 Tax=Euplotes crassus TaxID=5936 RepID=A0AAD1XZZ7_EUPCR|nr:unnamed protein product [Moneuplotes crassus]
MCILMLCIMAVAANVCQNDAQKAGSPLSISFGMAGITYVYLLDILEDQDSELLYFIGWFGSPAPYDTIIYKSGPALAKVQVMTYDIYSNYRLYAMSPSKEFIYIQDHTTEKIFEVRTSDLVISRELSVSSASVSFNTNMEVSEGFFFSLISSSVMHTCRWNMADTNLDCFTFGVNSQANLAPINADLLFFGSTDTAADQYYLVNYNFSSSSLAWKKSIACPTSGCGSKFSSSLVSRDEEWVYTMVLYDENFIFQKLSITDGSTQSSGLIWNDSEYVDSYCMKEFSGFIAIQIASSSSSYGKRLILVSPSAAEVVKEYKSVESRAYAIGRLVYKEEELIFHSGRIEPSYAFFLARSPTNNIGQLAEFEEDTPLFSPTTTFYQVSSTTSNPSLTSSTKTLTISISSSITTTDITPSTNPSFTTYVALWNQDYLKTVQSNASVKLEFTWACAQSANYTAISFSLAQTGSNTIPEWVQLDAGNQELHLNITPKLTEKKTFYFSLQISFNSEVHYKKFEITVEKCSIQNCDRCTLGDHSTCEACSDGYQSSDGQTLCSKVESPAENAPAGATQTATAFIGASMIIAAASSALSFTSVNSIFCMMNSLQLAILLPLVPEYFSLKVLDFLNGMGFAMLSLDFIHLKDIPFVKTITNWVKYPQTDEYLEEIGMSSGSSLVNYFSLISLTILLVICHICVYLFTKCARKSEREKCKKFFNKLFEFFTFNIYIRTFIQAFMFTILCTFSEMYSLNLKTTTVKISFGFCIVTVMVCFCLLILSLYMYKKSFPEIDNEKYWACKEFFNGVKDGRYSKLYTTIFLMLRVMLVALVIFGKTIPSLYKATAFYLINIAYGGYLLVVRPYDNPQDNIVECINQVLFCFLAVPLSWLKTKSSWTSFYEGFYIKILMASPIIGSIVCFIFLIKSIISRIKKIKSTTKVQNLPLPNIISGNPRRFHIHEESKLSHATPNSVLKYSSNLSLQLSEIPTNIQNPSLQHIARIREENINRDRMRIQMRKQNLN